MPPLKIQAAVAALLLPLPLGAGLGLKSANPASKLSSCSAGTVTPLLLGNHSLLPLRYTCLTVKYSRLLNVLRHAATGPACPASSGLVSSLKPIGLKVLIRVYLLPFGAAVTINRSMKRQGQG